MAKELELLKESINVKILELLSGSKELDSYQIGREIGIDERITTLYLAILEKYGYVHGQIRNVTAKGKSVLRRRYCITKKGLGALFELTKG